MIETLDELFNKIQYNNLFKITEYLKDYTGKDWKKYIIDYLKKNQKHTHQKDKKQNR